MNGSSSTARKVMNTYLRNPLESLTEHLQRDKRLLFCIDDTDCTSNMMCITRVALSVRTVILSEVNISSHHVIFDANGSSKYLIPQWCQ